MERTPRVLLVEDDPVSSRVFTLALERSGLQVDACGCARSAREAATRAAHDLWLIDAHLPDGDGIGLIADLRRCASATRAIAHTASHDAALHARLRAAGFADVLVKPLPAAVLGAAVAEALALPLPAPDPPAAAPDAHGGPGDRWDDAQALRALGGRRESLVALRRLFLQELPDALARCRDAVRTDDGAALHATLHRLQAGTAFVGAAALTRCVHALRDAPDAAALAAFEHEVQALLAAAATEAE